MDPTSQFLREGLLGAIIVVEASVIVVLYRGYISEKDKRAADNLQLYKEKTNDEKDWLSLMGGFKNSIDTAIAIFNKLNSNDI